MPSQSEINQDRSEQLNKSDNIIFLDAYRKTKADNNSRRENSHTNTSSHNLNLTNLSKNAITNHHTLKSSLQDQDTKDLSTNPNIPGEAQQTPSTTIDATSLSVESKNPDQLLSNQRVSNAIKASITEALSDKLTPEWIDWIAQQSAHTVMEMPDVKAFATLQNAFFRKANGSLIEKRDDWESVAKNGKASECLKKYYPEAGTIHLTAAELGQISPKLYKALDNEGGISKHLMDIRSYTKVLGEFSVQAFLNVPIKKIGSYFLAMSKNQESLSV